jgi:uncharacterized cupredoxin-like copper-binding protein
MSRWRTLGIATVAAVAAGVGAFTAASAATSAPRVVELTIHNSAFDKPVVTVTRGETVEFVVHNTDPIAHELIVGPADVQLRHELGTEPLHGRRPGEVSVPAGATAATRYRTTTQEPIEFACHLPGHFAYGMHGVVRVVSRR